MVNKTVMRLNVRNDCNKCKKVALHSVTKMEGIDSLSISMKDSTLTVIGEADSVSVANMLRRKFKCAEMIYGGPLPPPPPPPKKEEPKKEEKPKEEKKEEKPKEEKKEEKPKEEKKEEKPKEEKKEEAPAPAPAPEKKEEKPKEEKKEEAPAPAPAPAPTPVVVQPAPHMKHWYQECGAQCHPPCSVCSSRPDLMWPRYHQPGAPNEVWYVWNEEKQESCTIM